MRPDTTLPAVSLRCRVCDEPNGQPHYGTICCPSCKGFFRRVYISDTKTECYRGNMCVIRINNRNACRACRFKKCLKAGMNAKDIREKHDKNSPKPRPSTSTSEMTLDQSIPSSSSIDTKILESDDIGSPMMFHKNEAEKLKTAKEMTQIYVNLDKYCENIYCESNMSKDEENMLIDKMLSCSVSELIQKNSPQCPRFKREWRPLEMLNFNNFARSWSRSIVHFLDYSTRIPDFKKLSLSDQREWFISRLVPCTLFTMSCQTRQEQCEGLLFGCNNVFPWREHQLSEVDDEHLKSLFTLITQTLFDVVIVPMVKLKFTDTHCALIKACIFFSQGISLTSVSDGVFEIMRKQYSIHKEALMALVLEGVTDYSQQTYILFQIEDLLSAIERVSSQFDREVQYFDFLGLPIVKKRMLSECHVDKRM